MNRLDYINLIEDGSFETLNVSVGDCCTSYELRNEAMINVSRSNDSFHNRYSLNLTSSNHCACINKQIRGFENTIYLISFYYKGDNPKFCNWVVGDDKCLPVKKLPSANQWTKYEQLLIFTNNSESAYIYFYADSDGTKTVTNLYDDLQVHKLIPMQRNGDFNQNETYIIKTKADNNVNGEMISDVVDGEAYFMVKGEPIVTIKFPWTEVVIIMLMLFVIIRLLFKKQISEFEREIAGEAKDIARDIRNEIKDIKESLSEKDSGNDTHEKEEPENIQKTTAEKD